LRMDTPQRRSHMAAEIVTRKTTEFPILVEEGTDSCDGAYLA